MRKYFICLLLLAAAAAFGQPFERFFKNQTMRVDYFHTGTKGTETLARDKVLLEGEWPGSLVNLVDTMNLGEYQFRVIDIATSAVIYSRGFSSMFNEWQSTDEALKGIYRTLHETIRFPLPKQPVQVVIARRDKAMIFHEVFSTVIDPNNPSEVVKARRPSPYKTGKVFASGDPHTKVDIVVLGDGYAKKDMEKFRKDAKHFTDVLFDTEPFKSHRDDFNVWTVEVESPESGISKPGKNEWKNNPLGTTYDTFGSARYVLTEENRTLHDVCALVPYEHICILVNDNRYGGGGIFNLYSTCYTINDQPGQEWQMDYVYVHEFGHSFGGLGDEYYSSQVAYNDFYAKGVEPWEPNITAHPEKESLKWRALADPSLALPTPWGKATYDSLERERGKLDRLAPDYYQKREPLYKASQAILKDPKFTGKVGAFEGAAYVSEGFYRPSVDCRMFSLSLVAFDPVCNAALVRMIEFYSK